MKAILNVVLYELEEKINRQIVVDNNISLKDLCEFIIVSMHGDRFPIYNVEYDDTYYFPSEVTDGNLVFKKMNVRKGETFYIRYDFDNGYEFDVTVDDITSDCFDKDVYFEVLSGNGYGVLEGKRVHNLVWLLDTNDYSYLRKSEKDYLEKEFNVADVNNKVKEYIEYRKEMLKPKRYILNVSLEGFGSQIKRKISVNNDITISDFCKRVIVAMRGDLSHGYGVKINKDYLSEYYDDASFYYLGLKEKQRLKVIYDWGDHWIFNVSVSKIIDGYDEYDFKVLSGKGYGIVDDCGGTWGLGKIFDGSDISWGKYDINDFNLDKCNEDLKKYFGSGKIC